ncbi:MAG TPA: YkgJ family cysteine cluster protein [Rhizomicrobium sp.]|jgi:Fe-S-cluster containining protein|nr:YkgJ family cysteine cluster protein [Rhizomicrobium sp.]
MDRSERRRQLKADSKLIANGLDPINNPQQQIPSLMRVLAEELRAARGAGSIDALMTFFYENMSQSMRRLRSVPLACGKGCSHCCVSWVAVSAPEALFVRNAIPAAKMAATRESVSRMSQLTFGKSPHERLAMAVPCPLLIDRICSVYAHRPIVCRTAVSINAEVCERSFIRHSGEPIPSPAWFTVIRMSYDLALCGAIRHEGLSLISCEFNSALKSVLENPLAEQQWLSGENVLVGLQEDPNGDPFRDSTNQQIYAAAFA